MRLKLIKTQLVYFLFLKRKNKYKIIINMLKNGLKCIKKDMHLVISCYYTITIFKNIIYKRLWKSNYKIEDFFII